MRRRDCIAGLLLVVAAGRAQAQQPGKVYRFAIVYSAVPVEVQKENAKSPASRMNWAKLRAHGFVEGQNLVVKRYSGEGREDTFFIELAAQVVRSRPDVILTDSSRLVLAFKAATTAIPIVGITSDPVADGIVPSLARPGGNITGVNIHPGLDIYGKRLQLLAEAVPGLSKIGVLISRRGWELAEGVAMREAARRAGMSIVGPTLEAPVQEAEYQRVIAAMAGAGAEGLVVASQPESGTNVRLIAELIKNARLPAIWSYPDTVAAGALMAFGPDFSEAFLHAFDDVGQILKGANPGDIPYYQVTKFELIINLKAAKTLGLSIPPSLFAQADEVIE